MKKIRKHIENAMMNDGFERNTTASLTYCSIGLFVMVTQFTSPDGFWGFLLCGFLILAVNLGRWSISRKYMNGTLEKPEESFGTLKMLLNINAILWCLTLAYLFQLNSVVSSPSVIALAITTGIGAGGILSLAVFQREQKIFFIATMGIPSLILFAKFAESRQGSDILMAVVLLVGFFYFYRQSRKVRDMIVDSYISRFQLEEEQDNLQNTLFELKKTQDELLIEKAKSLSAERLAAVGAFASGISHEINNPLAILNAQIFRIQKVVTAQNIPTLSEELKPSFEKMVQTNYRISEIIKGLRNFANEEAEKEPDSDISLGKLMEASLVFTREKIKNTGVDLIVDPIPEIDLFVQNNRIAQAIFQLIKNAYDAVKESPEKKIQIHFKTDANFLTIQIEDSGPGVPSKFRDQIFDPFFTTKEVGQGTGLGLSIAKGIIEGHGGEIRLLEGSPHTCFEVAIPLDRSDSVKNAA